VKFLYPGFLIALVLFLVGCASQNNQVTPPPPPAQYAISGTVVNLAGSNGGLVLQNNGKDDLPISANGNFQFAATIASGSPFSVTVLTQPSSPVQQCTVANGNGTATANVTSVKVECGHNEWVWMTGSQAINQIGTYGTLESPAPANTPGGRQSPATWTDSSGNFWLFGGYGYDSNGTLMPMSDLWEFSTGQWAWKGGPTLTGQSGNYGSLGLAGPNNIPGARFQPASWTDASGNFWLFGGNGFDAVGNESPMNDLWKYNAGEWTWVSGSNVGLQNGHYGTLGVADPSNLPGGRCSTAVWKDSSGNHGYDSIGANGYLNDLWRYSEGQWTWLGGSNIANQPSAYGIQGIGAVSNIPGARWAGMAWTDSQGNAWLFGGSAFFTPAIAGFANDLWKYNDGQWTWVSGSNAPYQHSTYGTEGTLSPGNTPGGRFFLNGWVDASDNLWLLGGYGQIPASTGNLNDLWMYMP
jgi:hypothetical protein